MPCYRVQTGEKLLHTEESNKVAMTWLLWIKSRTYKGHFWDNFQILTKVCRVDRRDQCQLPSMQESYLTKRLPTHSWLCGTSGLKPAICWFSFSDNSYLQALHRERIESMRWCIDGENENWAQGRVAWWVGKGQSKVTRAHNTPINYRDTPKGNSAVQSWVWGGIRYVRAMREQS